MDKMEKGYLAALQMVPGIGTAKLRKLVSFFGSARQAWQADRRDLFLSGYLQEANCNELVRLRGSLDVEILLKQWEKNGVWLCCWQDEAYPYWLAATAMPPAILYCRGVLPAHDHLLAAVGARKATAYGKNCAQTLAADLSRAGFCLVSGAARGIDTAVHQGVLAAGGSTVAVLGCGVDVAYPPENRKLLAMIAEQGCIVSEYPPQALPFPGAFPARNRIISGMSRGVLVVEAAEKSGALITADFALEEGRDVFAVPGSVFSAMSKGTHRLIQQGAKLVQSAADVLEEYGLAGQTVSAPLPTLTKEEQIVYDSLNYEIPLSLEEIIMQTGLLPAMAAYSILQLELCGLAAEQDGQKYVRRKEGIR